MRYFTSFFFVLFTLSYSHGIVVKSPEPLKGIYTHVSALFGPMPGSLDISAEVVVADPPEACSFLHTNTTFYQGKIVLVRRGSCYFSDKVLTVQKYGGLAMLLGNSDPSQLFPMAATQTIASQVAIPSVFISMADYQTFVSYSSLGTSTPLIVSLTSLGEDFSVWSSIFSAIWGSPTTSSNPGSTSSTSTSTSGRSLFSVQSTWLMWAIPLLSLLVFQLYCLVRCCQSGLFLHQLRQLSRTINQHFRNRPPSQEHQLLPEVDALDAAAIAPSDHQSPSPPSSTSGFPASSSPAPWHGHDLNSPLNDIELSESRIDSVRSGDGVRSHSAMPNVFVSRSEVEAKYI